MFLLQRLQMHKDIFVAAVANAHIYNVTAVATNARYYASTVATVKWYLYCNYCKKCSRIFMLQLFQTLRNIFVATVANVQDIYVATVANTQWYLCFNSCMLNWIFLCCICGKYSRILYAATQRYVCCNCSRNFVFSFNKISFK